MTGKIQAEPTAAAEPEPLEGPPPPGIFSTSLRSEHEQIHHLLRRRSAATRLIRPGADAHQDTSRN